MGGAVDRGLRVGRKVLLDSTPVKDAVRVAVAGGIAPHGSCCSSHRGCPGPERCRADAARKRFMSGTWVSG
jgi:hypothetical protein